MNYICAIVKDEHDYIREWVLHHLSLGFDQIILYDNNSSRSYVRELEDLMSSGHVQVKNWSSREQRRQINAYNDFVNEIIFKNR